MAIMVKGTCAESDAPFKWPTRSLKALTSLSFLTRHTDKIVKKFTFNYFCFAIASVLDWDHFWSKFFQRTLSRSARNSIMVVLKCIKSTKSRPKLIIFGNRGFKLAIFGSI